MIANYRIEYKEVLVMAERKCSVCGIEESPKTGGWLRKWFSCPTCNIFVCDSCAKKQLEEDKKIKDLKNANFMDPTARVTAVCPSCAHHLVHMN